MQKIVCVFDKSTLASPLKCSYKNSIIVHQTSSACDNVPLQHLLVHGPAIETLPPPFPHPPPGIFGDNDFWIAQYASFQYLLVCKILCF